MFALSVNNKKILSIHIFCSQEGPERLCQPVELRIENLM